MARHNQPGRYRAYLLRCWEERSCLEAQPVVWRFSLEDPHTGMQHGFATLEAVVAALQQALAADGATSPTWISEQQPITNEKEDRQ